MSMSGQMQQDDDIRLLIERYGQRLPRQTFAILVEHLGLTDTIKVLDKTIDDINAKAYDPTRFTLLAVDLENRQDYDKMNRIMESIMAIRKGETDLLRLIVKQFDRISAPWVDLNKMRAPRDLQFDYTKSDGRVETVRVPSYHDMACDLQRFEVCYLMATLYNIPQRRQIVKMLNQRLSSYPYHPYDSQWTHNPIETRYIMYVALYIRASIRDTISLDYVEGVNKRVQLAMDKQLLKWALQLRKDSEEVAASMC